MEPEKPTSNSSNTSRPCPTELKFVEIFSEDGIIQMPEEALDKSWERNIVGFFLDQGLSSFHAVQSIAMKVWTERGLQDVRSAETGFFLFRFRSEEDVKSVLSSGPWMFGHQPIVIQKWHAQYTFDKSRISKLPVWIRLFDLPYPMWTTEGLSVVASSIGRPLFCDRMTSEQTKLSYARICVEMDANSDAVSEIRLQSVLSPDPITVRIEYEWKPKRCSKCCVFGHACHEVSQKTKGIDKVENSDYGDTRDKHE